MVCSTAAVCSSRLLGALPGCPRPPDGRGAAASPLLPLLPAVPHVGEPGPEPHEHVGRLPPAAPFAIGHNAHELPVRPAGAGAPRARVARPIARVDLSPERSKGRGEAPRYSAALGPVTFRSRFTRTFGGSGRTLLVLDPGSRCVLCHMKGVRFVTGGVTFVTWKKRNPRLCSGPLTLQWVSASP